MKKALSAVVVVFGFLFLSGCATIISGTGQSVTFDSSPQGAEVYIDGAQVGSTPMTLKIEKSKKDTVMIKKEGYKTLSRDLTKSFDSVALLNVFWDLSTTDFITGAAMEYEPNSYFFELQPE
ncbi:PEGA domain-containing protein [Hydrogenovibrio sp. SC-1]|uniref:PEGA domain-containing protein n=1 Tax=Hydrogenovibrio sp. SC-1 TaxID=2065820 RepID=UPI000C7DF6C0|nr:PEGA domain-containing protein [Hydrogenovibrio sp. SC-1]PLA75022.1 PEGA domain-containing protein [Hydrogenovibrio sp. SC-1]